MRLHIVAGLAVVLATTASQAQTNRITAAAEALGATGLNAIQYSGGASCSASDRRSSRATPAALHRAHLQCRDRLSHAGNASRSSTVQGEHPPRGGAAQPVAADQRTISVVSGKSAWQEHRADSHPGAVGDRLRQIWAMPHGVIKAALANGGKVDGNTVTVNVGGREVKAVLNARNLVEKVTYLSTNEVVGDYPIEISYTDYAVFGGGVFPRHIVQTEDGFPTLDITVNAVTPNVAVELDVPANVRTAIPAAAAGRGRKARGWRLVPLDAQRWSWAVESRIM